MKGRQGCSLPFEIPDSSVKLRNLRLGRYLGSGNLNVDWGEWFLDFSERTFPSGLYLLHFSEENVTLFQIDFPNFPAGVQPTVGVRTALRVVPPFLAAVRAHRQVLANYAIDSCKTELDAFGEGSSKPQVTSKTSILGNGRSRNNSSCTVQTEQSGWVTSHDVRDHAVPAVKPSASLAPPEIACSKHSLADSAFVLERHLSLPHLLGDLM